MKNSNLTLPNKLTILRILLILPILFLIHKGYFVNATLVTLFAVVTDYIDGKIARCTNTETELGTILDPVADKLLIMMVLWAFMSKDMLNPYYFALSSTRDILQLLSIPILLSYKKISFRVAPSTVAKVATLLKFVIMLLLLLMSIFSINKPILLLPLLTLSAAFEIYILITYLKRFTEIYRGVHDTFN